MFIELTVDATTNNNVIFHISKQDFEARLEKFYSTNGITIRCAEYPQWEPKYNEFYVRGATSNKDAIEMMVSYNDFLRIKTAVDEFNKFHEKTETDEKIPVAVFNDVYADIDEMVGILDKMADDMVDVTSRLEAIRRRINSVRVSSDPT